MKSASKYDIIHIAKLSKLSIDKKDITSLRNVFRDDVIENDRILNQEECLSNAKNAYNGYFMVEAIFNEI